VLYVREGQFLADESQHGTPVANVDELEVSVLSITCGIYRNPVCEWE